MVAYISYTYLRNSQDTRSRNIVDYIAACLCLIESIFKLQMPVTVLLMYPKNLLLVGSALANAVIENETVRFMLDSKFGQQGIFFYSVVSLSNAVRSYDSMHNIFVELQTLAFSEILKAASYFQ